MSGKPAIEGGQPVREAFLPFQRPWTGVEEEQEVIEAIRSGWMTMGPRTMEFEKRFAEFIGCAHAVAVNSCTAGLHLGMVINGVGVGDEVITSPITFASTANVIVHQGATPVFAEIEPDTLNIDAARIEERITERTRGIIPVDFCGHPCDMEQIHDLARRYGLFVVEDAAHAVGASYRDRSVGTLSPLTSFSFYATKNMTTGEGGMITTGDAGLADRCRQLRLHGMSLDAWKRYGGSGFKRWQVTAPGYKYNMTDLQAAIGLHQLKRLPGFNDIRRRYMDWYREKLRDLEEIEFLVEKEYAASSHHMCVLKIKTGLLRCDRNHLLDAMQAEGIGVGIHFEAVHLQPFYREAFGCKPGMLPAAEDIAARILSIPLYPRLEEKDLEDVAEAVRKLITFYRR
ncbi:DegT/DnrJ/EryC1/StrS family aminotransferase [bacterium]|nr:DegT/DnrJ/EryC1/StrS family aminotransferase [candidate division CSSED10-310 bacterium]